MKKTVLLLIAFFSLNLSSSTPTFSQMAPKEVDALVQAALEKFQVAGAAVAIVKDGKVVEALLG